MRNGLAFRPLPPGPQSGAFASRLLPLEVRRRLAYHHRALAAAQYVRDHLDGEITLECVSARACMVPTAFSRYFGSKVGVRFSWFVKTVRVEHAVELLEQRDYACSELARRCGYRSYCTFTRAFRDVMGETPSSYRRRYLLGRTRAVA